MINDHGTACQCSQCQMHVQSMSTTVPLNRPSPPVEPKCDLCEQTEGHARWCTRDKTWSDGLPTELKCAPNPILSCVCSRGTKCCPIDHRPPDTSDAELKCERCGFSDDERIYCSQANCPRVDRPPATTEPAEEDLFVPPDPTAEYREGDIDKFFGCMAPTASAIDTEDAKALEDRAKHFWREETYAEELPHKRLARFTQAEIERQKPAIIERFVEEVAKEVRVSRANSAWEIIRAMQTVKERMT